MSRPLLARKKSMHRRVLTLMLVFTMVLPILPVSPLPGVESNREVQANTTQTPTINIGDYIRFGKYNDDPILWRVIHKDADGNPILFANDILTIKAFDTPGSYHSSNSSRMNYGSNYYKDSNIRQWLNSNSSNSGSNVIDWIQNDPSATNFGGNSKNQYNTEKGFLADGNFTEVERNLIKPYTHKVMLASTDQAKKDGGTSSHIFNESISTAVQNYDTTAYFQNVTDRIFMLSVKQLKEWVYDNRGVLGNTFTAARPTWQATQQSLYKDPSGLNSYANWYYWLNTPMPEHSNLVRCVISDANGSLDSNHASTYFFGVRPAVHLNAGAANFATGGTGSYSNPYVVGSQPPDTQAPSAPTNVVADRATPNSLTLNWTASTDNVGVVSYDIFNGSNVIGTVGRSGGNAPVTTFDVFGLSRGTSYSFTVRAKDAAGNISASSSTLSLSYFQPSSLNVGHYIQFGKYNEAPIKWRVVHKDSNGDPILLSDQILTIKPFDARGSYHSGNTTRVNSGSNFYKDSNIRQWLNSSEQAIDWIQNDPSAVNLGGGSNKNAYETERGFLADGNFTASERSLIKPYTHRVVLAEADQAKKEGGTVPHIQETSLENVLQNYDTTAHYQNVSDRVFMLSVKQVKEWLYDQRGVLGTNYHAAKPTWQATVQSTFKDSNLNSYKNWFYWLNSPLTNDASMLRIVSSDTNGSFDVYNAHGVFIGVRPALYLNLSSAVNLSYGTGTFGEPFVISSSHMMQVDSQPPSAPGQLVVSDVGKSMLTLSWGASTDNVAVTGYEVYQGEALIGTISSSGGSAPATMRVVSGLTHNTNYTFRVLAVDAWSNRSSAVTLTARTLSPASNILLDDSAVTENEPIGTIVGSLSALDPDVGDQSHLFTLVDGNGADHNSLFSINGKQLLTASSFNFESKSSYSVRVRATDQHGLAFEKAMTIQIVDANEPPTGISLSASTIAENNGANAVVGTLSHNDPDTNQTFAYALVAGAGDTDNATFYISANQLLVTSANALNFESKASYSVRVQVTDGSMSYAQAFPITVTNVNEAPVIQAIADVTIMEDLPLTITASLSDVDGTVPVLSVTGGSSSTVSVTVAGNKVTITPAPNYHTAFQWITFTATASDGQLTNSTTFRVRVNGVNDRAIMAEIGDRTLTEDVAMDIPLSIVEIEGSTPTISITGGSAQTVQASVSQVTADGISAEGWPKFKAMLRLTPTANYQSMEWLSFSMMIHDSEITSITRTFRVNVASVADAPILPDLANRQVTEDTPLSFDVELLEADGITPQLTVSGGSANTVQASLGAIVPNGTGTDGYQKYRSTLTLTPAANYRTETPLSFTVTLNAGAFSIAKSFQVTVANVDDAPSGLALSHTAITENNSVGAFVGTFATTDVDVANGDLFVYELVSGQGAQHNQLFTVSGNRLLAARTFDFEEQATPSFSIRVRTTDEAGLSFERTFTIIVSDQVEDSLQIGQYVRFGSYKGEPLVWRIIQMNANGNPLLFADRIIALKSFDASGAFHSVIAKRATEGSNFYADANLRQWLNSSATTIAWKQNTPIAANLWWQQNPYADEPGFLHDHHFSAAQRQLIVPLTHKVMLAPVDESYKLGGSAPHVYNGSIATSTQNYDSDAMYMNVSDSVFLLSVKQLQEYVQARGWDIKAKPSAGAVANSQFKSQSVHVDANWHYWLNTPVTLASHPHAVRAVYSGGEVYDMAAKLDNIGVRPALQLDGAKLVRFAGEGTLANPFEFNDQPRDLMLSTTQLTDNLAPASQVATVSANDTNAGDALAFSLVNGDGANDNASFDMVGNKLITKYGVQYETKSAYSIRLRATDSKGDFVEKAFLLQVIDVVDAPVIEASSTLELLEDTSDSLTVRVLDEDSASVQFTVSGSVADKVQVHVEELSTESQSWADGRQYRLTFTAPDNYFHHVPQSFVLRADDGVNETVHNILLTVRELNDAPLAQALTLAVHEDEVVNGEWLISDVDDSDLTVQIVQAPQKGSLQWNAADRQFEYRPNANISGSDTIQYRVFDGKIYSAPATVHVTITEVADPPKDLAFVGSIAENVPSGRLVGTLQAMDVDGNDTLTFTLLSNEDNADHEAFTLVENRLYSQKVFNFEAKSSYALRFMVSDGLHQVVLNVQVPISNVNEAPVGADVTFDMAEDETLQGELSALDPEGGTLQFVMVEQPPGEMFWNYLWNGQFYYRAPQNFNGTLTMQYRVFDGELYSNPHTITFRIDPRPDAPTELSASKTSIAENLPADSQVAQLNVLDPDGEGGTFAIRLLGGGYMESWYGYSYGFQDVPFKLVGKTLYTTEPLNYELQQAYRLHFEVEDDGGAMTFALNFSVQNVNEPPTGEYITIDMLEDELYSGHLPGFDADTYGGDLQFEAVEHSAGDLFMNVERAGHFYYRPPLNKFGVETLKYRVFDGEFYSEVYTVTFQIANQPEAPSDLLLTAKPFHEGSAVGTLAAELAVVDSDVGDIHQITLLGQKMDFGYSYGCSSWYDYGYGANYMPVPFLLDGNKLYVSGPLDYEQKQRYCLYFEVNDGSFAQVFGVSLNIADINEAPTDLQLHSQLFDGMGKHSIAGYLSAVDPDYSSFSLQYALVSGDGDVDNHKFYLHEFNRSELRLRVASDRDEQSTYQIRVRVSDGTHTFEKALQLSMQDEDSGIRLSNKLIAENTSPNTVVGTLSLVQNTTPGANGVYYFLSPPPYWIAEDDRVAFAIDGNQLIATQSFDYETKDEYRIYIGAWDGNGYVIRTVVIRVEDRNEMMHLNSTFAYSLAENSGANQPALQLTVFDPDRQNAAFYQPLQYSLVAGEGDADNHRFYMSGFVVKTKASLDYEEQRSYQIRVRVTDGTNVQEYPLVISLINLNEAPTLTLSNPSLIENAPVHTPVGKLLGVDPDGADVALSYAFVSGAGDTDNDKFNIDGDELKARVSFDYEQRVQYSVRVRVTDGHLANEYVLVVQIVDVDDEAPTVPGSFRTISKGATEFTLSWTISTDNVAVTGYEIVEVSAGQAQQVIAVVTEPTYLLTGMTFGTTKTYAVRAIDANGNYSPFSTPLTVTLIDQIAPTRPQQLSISNLTPNGFVVNWAPATDNVAVTSYNVYRNGKYVASTTTTRYTFSGLTLGVTSSITVLAMDAMKNRSVMSEALTVTTADVIAPTRPVGLSASQLTANQLTLQWTPSTDQVGVSHYEVFLDSVLLGSASSNSFPVTGLLARTKYVFSVIAVDAAGNKSAASTPLNLTTPAFIGIDTLPPSIPTVLTSSQVTETGFRVAWTASTDNAGVTGYNVYLSGKYVATVSSTFYHFTGLIAGTGYNVTVLAIDAARNRSGLSQSMTVTTVALPPDTVAPGVPSNLVSSNATSNGFRVSWTAVSDNRGVSGYNVYRNGVYIATVSSTSYTFSGLSAKTTHSIRVLAFDAARNRSPLSTILTVNTN